MTPAIMPVAPGRDHTAPPADPRLRAAVTDVLAMVADRLPDGADAAEVLPVIRSAVRAWAERQVRFGGGVLAASDAEALAQGVYDQRYGLGPLED